MDEWRAVSRHGFTHCNECSFEYELEEVNEEELDGLRHSRMFKFRTMVARDSLIAFMVLQLVITALGFTVSQIDQPG